MVWISTCGGANSGNTSTFAFGIWDTPSTIIAAAANSTSHLNRRLLETIQRITCYPLPSVASCDVKLGAVHLGRTNSHDLGADSRPL